MRSEMEPSLYKDVHSLIRWQKQRVVKALEEEFCLNHNDSTRRSNLFFTPGFLPIQYFYAHSPRVIARHIVMVTQFLDCNNDMVSVESKDGRMITYFCNVGYDIPGILLKLLKENIDMDINGFDSIYTPAGYRIITFHKRLHELPYYDEEAKLQEKIIVQMIKNTRDPNAEIFLRSLPKNYMIEEICSHRSESRIMRHLDMFSKAIANAGKAQVVGSAVLLEPGQDVRVMGKNRLSVCVMNANDRFSVELLSCILQLQINMVRSYYDQFYLPDNKGTVKLYSIYFDDESKVEQAIQAIQAIKIENHIPEMFSREGLEQEMALCIRALTDEKRTVEDCIPTIKKLQELAKQNIDPENKNDFGNFYLNVLSEFFKSADIVGLGEHYEILRGLMSFENVEEFFVEAKYDGKTVHKKGYRLRHSSVRGPAKGGLRLHPLAELSEVGALSFMMTWKCAKSKILFGGGKGGATMMPREFQDQMDYSVAISSFGKSLFLETGPFLDVPAGDVNCGAPEIGRIFEGYKAALRDLVSLVFASKFGAARIGKKLVNVQQARKILEHNFEIDPYDDDQLKMLMTNDYYLSLVVASQITGKPKFGVNVRNGATGRGVTYCLLAAVGQMYLDGRWECKDPIEGEELKLLKKASSLGEHDLVANSKEPLLTKIEWDQLTYIIYPKLLKDKRVILQGAGKVGMSIVHEVVKFGVKIVGLADVGGAIYGEHFEEEDILKAIKETGSVVGLEAKAKKVFKGVKEGAQILVQDCDILMPCALENAITLANANEIKANLLVSGANGPISPKAAEILFAKGKSIVYDFLANAGGVTASYFEWLRGLAERYRYEAEMINHVPFDISVMEKYIMPEFLARMKEVLQQKESPVVDKLWETILRDIMVCGLNDDYRRSKEWNVRMKISGFVDSMLRVLSAKILKSGRIPAVKIWETLNQETKGYIRKYFDHPELNRPELQEVISYLKD